MGKDGGVEASVAEARSPKIATIREAFAFSRPVKQVKLAVEIDAGCVTIGLLFADNQEKCSSIQSSLNVRREMTPTGRQFTRVLIFTSALLLATGFANATISCAAICQAFVAPQIPSGRSIGDMGVSDFGVGSGTRETRPRGSVVQPQFEAAQRWGDGLTPESDGPMVFGPVDGDVPTIGNDRGFGGQAFDSRSNTTIPNLRSTLGNSQDLPTPSSAPPARETSVRRPKADITEMPGREIVRQRYPDGTVQIARHVRLAENGDYVNDGQWKLFDRNGAVIAIGTYADGEMEGRWARLHSQSSGGIFMNPPFSQFQGPFTSKATFSVGLLSGAWTITDAKGRKVFEMPYKDGKRDGLAVWFYPSEQIYRRNAVFEQRARRATGSVRRSRKSHS